MLKLSHSSEPIGCADVALGNQALKNQPSCRGQEAPRLQSCDLQAADSRDMSAASGSKEKGTLTVPGAESMGPGQLPALQLLTRGLHWSSHSS